jgi:hypothetical protein
MSYAAAHQVPVLDDIEEYKSKLSDAGRRRHLSWGMDFDTRAIILEQEIGEHSSDEVKSQHLQNRESVRTRLIAEFGELAADAKLENFVAIGTKPFSVLAFHNALFHQVRQAYVVGAYYPALVGACALGERMLNHMVIDLRKHFVGTPEYKRVIRKQSFADWGFAIDVLESWNVLLPEAVTQFRSLMIIRHRSIHFNTSTYQTLKQDALSAILHLRTIIEQQFGSFAVRPWFIPGTVGHVFIRKDYEENPFVRTYFLPNCPFVGPLFAMRPGPSGWTFYDLLDYGRESLTDDEFAYAYNHRDPASVVQPN